MSNKIDSVYSEILEIDPKIRVYEEKIKQLKERRKKCEKYLIENIKSELNHKNEYKTNKNNLIKLNKITKYEIISQKFLKNNLAKFFFHRNDKDYKKNADEALKFILKLRQNQTTYIIKHT